MGQNIATLIYLGFLLLVLGGWFFASQRAQLGKAAQMALAWVFIFLGFIAVYGLWEDISGNFTTAQQSVDGNTITIPRAADGHYYATLKINNTPLRFLIDTGASDIVLNRQDVTRVGIHADDLNYIGSAQTANGIVRTAPVVLKQVSFGPFSDRNISASVTDGQMGISLLGMRYLQRFDRFEFTDDMLRLYR